MCLLEGVVFEVDVSLKWLPQQSELKSDTCITKKKNVRNNIANHYDAEASELMARTLTAWVADMLQVRGRRARCNPESIHLNRIIVANSIIITQAVI